MPLNDLALPFSLATGHEDPVVEFFIPVLKVAATYDVAVGYFTSGWLRDTADGFGEFALNGGVSRWVVSPELNEDDANTIVESDVSTTLQDYRERKLIEVIRSLQLETRRELCALIAANIIQFKIALPRNNKAGLFHAKIGIARDLDGNRVAFSGSYNLTAAAKSNWEHINVFKSWEAGEEKRVVNLEQRFCDLWSNADPTYDVSVPSLALIRLIKYEAGPQLEAYVSVKKKQKNEPSIALREYQKRAIECWGKNNGRGSYIMATGSGKTVTALATVEKLVSKVVEVERKPLFVLIVLPLKHLLDQWFDEAIKFGFDPIKCYESSTSWRGALASILGVLKVTREGCVMALVTNSTFSMAHFQSMIKGINTDFLLVADEAHNLGSNTYLKALPDNANFRLALSATPDRHNDAEGTEALFEYFGKPAIEFTLKDAIDSKFLCQYEYHPHLCLMSEAEYEEYLELSNLIAHEAMLSEAGGEKTKEHIRLIGKRTDLITGVESKLSILEHLLKLQIEAGGVSHTLVYCGSRRGEDDLRHIERSVKLIGGLGIKARKFTAEETLDERREILNLFEKGDLEAIAAIKCLDEGIDVPATRVAYILASTSNPREFIQRRGRVLRNSPGKDLAIIHDFLVAPPYRRHEGDDMVERELERAMEFSELALNAVACKAILQEFADEFGVQL